MAITAEMVGSIQTLKATTLPLPVFWRGKVRDNYIKPDGRIISVTTDRVSAYDRVLPQAIPYKGHFLTATSVHARQNTADIVESDLVAHPHPNIIVVERYDVYPAEFVVRGYLAGSAAKDYKNGKRDFFGVTLPEGLRENQELPFPIFTPTTKAKVGHDVTLATWQDFADLIGDKIIAKKLMEIAFVLYERGRETAGKHGYIFVDTKYEFGKPLVLVDEVHTHDSSRMMEQVLYERLFSSNAPPEKWNLAWMDKQYLRKWLEVMAGWAGEGESPSIPDKVVAGTSNRVAGSYKAITGKEPVYPTEPVTQEALINALAKSGFLR